MRTEHRRRCGMTKSKTVLDHYLWLIVIVVLMGVGARIYFDFKPLGLALVLSGAMLIIAMENSDMIHAVEEENITSKWYRSFLVHFATQETIAKFIYRYHGFVYGYVALFALINLISEPNAAEWLQTTIIIVELALFFIAVVTIFIRRIFVGAKYENG